MKETRMLYYPAVPSVNTPSPSIRGRSLRRMPRTARQRAGIAAQLVAGELYLARPTIAQAAALAGANVLYTRLALRLDKTGRADLAADRSVTLPAVPKRPAPPAALVDGSRRDAAHRKAGDASQLRQSARRQLAPAGRDCRAVQHGRCRLEQQGPCCRHGD